MFITHPFLFYLWTPLAGESRQMFLNAYRIKYLALQRKTIHTEILLQNAEKPCDRAIFFILMHWNDKFQQWIQ